MLQDPRHILLSQMGIPIIVAFRTMWTANSVAFRNNITPRAESGLSRCQAATSVVIIEWFGLVLERGSSSEAVAIGQGEMGLS